MFFDKRVRSFVSCTTVTLKLNCAGFQMKQATQLKKDHINLPGPLMIMSNEDKHISGFLVLDLRK